MYGPQNLAALNNALTVPSKRALTVYGVSANTGVTAAFEATLDGSNWFAVLAQKADTGEWVSGVAASETGAFYVPASGWKSTRIRQTNAVAGPLTVSADAAIFGGPVNGARGLYNAASPTLAERGTYQQRVDQSGNALVSMGTDIAGEDRTNNRMRVYSPASAGYYAGNGTTTFKSGPGHFSGLYVGTPTNGATITVYDNTAGSGTKILEIGAAAVGVYPFDCDFAIGCTMVVAGSAVGGLPAGNIYLW